VSAAKPTEYTVVMEYSVLVTSEDLYDDEPQLTAEIAEKIALGWMEEPEHCNPQVKVIHEGKVLRHTIDGEVQT
jgi:hypothetical protein